MQIRCLMKRKSPFEIVLKAEIDQCSMHVLLLAQKGEEFPVIANHNIENTAPTKRLEKIVFHGHLTEKLDSTVASPLAEA